MRYHYRKTFSLKAIFLVALTCNVFISVIAQNFRMKSHFFANRQSMMPSVIGLNDGLIIHGNYRGQWFGVEGSPQEQELATSLYIPGIKSAVGLSINNEILGAFRTTQIETQFAYRLKTNNLNMAIGLSLGFENSILKGDVLTTPDQQPGNPNTDPYLPSTGETFFRPLMGMGFSMQVKGIQLDLAASNLLNSASKINGDSLVLNYRRGSIMTTHVSYTKKIGSNFSITPGVQFQTDFIKNQTTLYFLGEYKSMFHFGMMYRGYNKFSNDALIPILGFQPLNEMKIFYTYEITTSGLNRSTSGTHEISLTYNIPQDKIFKKGKVSYNPRFL